MGDAPPVIDSRSGFVDALLWGFARATGAKARRIVCVSPDFADWPLGDAALLDSLGQWLRLPKRQLVLLAATFDEMPRRQARFVAWRRDWSHAIAAFAAPREAQADLPTLLFDDRGTLVRLIDPVHWRGRLSDDEASARPWRDEVDAVLQRSEPAFPVNALGL